MTTAFTVNKIETNVFTADTEAGHFNTYRREHLDSYGNPIMIIVPPAYIGKLKTAHKVRNRDMYQTQSYNFEEDFKAFVSEYMTVWGADNGQ